MPRPQKSRPNLQARIGVHFGDDRDNYQSKGDGALVLSRVLRDKAALIVLDDVWDHKLIDRFPINGTACRLLITTRSGELMPVGNSGTLAPMKMGNCQYN